MNKTHIPFTWSRLLDIQSKLWKIVHYLEAFQQDQERSKEWRERHLHEAELITHTAIRDIDYFTDQCLIDGKRAFGLDEAPEKEAETTNES